jgi:hypothetical protein
LASGDVNGDGMADLIVGAPNTNSGAAGKVYVVLGTRSGFPDPLPLFVARRYQRVRTGRTAQVSGSGQPLDEDANGTAGGDFTLDLHRLYGDVNGDKTVNVTDLTAFRNGFGATTADENYQPFLGFNGDGVINLTDLTQFRSRFGVILPSSWTRCSSAVSRPRRATAREEPPGLVVVVRVKHGEVVRFGTIGGHEQDVIAHAPSVADQRSGPPCRLHPARSIPRRKKIRKIVAVARPLFRIRGCGVEEVSARS